MLKTRQKSYPQKALYLVYGKNIKASPKLFCNTRSFFFDTQQKEAALKQKPHKGEPGGSKVKAILDEAKVMNLPTTQIPVLALLDAGPSAEWICLFFFKKPKNNRGLKAKDLLV